MASVPVSHRVFTPFDVLFWGGLCVAPTLLALGAHLTKQDPPIPIAGWIALWAAVAGFWFVAVMFFRWKWRMAKNYRFVVTPPGVIVGWDNDQYCVSPEMVERELNAMAAKMAPSFPKALDALRGCVIWFREPTWLQDAKPGFVMRKVSGVQDGFLLVVGWQPDLAQSALQHECAHRVLQVFGGDPVESEAHERMARMGL